MRQAKPLTVLTLLLSAVAFMLATFSLVFVFACSSSKDEGEDTNTYEGVESNDEDDVWTAPAQNSPTSRYDSHYFVLSNGRYEYHGPVTLTRTGIDVSEYQGPIDWNAVADDGISFAFIRVGNRGTTEGHLYADDRFEENLDAAQEAGIQCGVYFFSQAVTEMEARDEAEFVIRALNGRELDYPIAFDYEISEGSRIQKIDNKTATACARAFCDVIAEAGYTPMLYGNRYDLARFDMSEFTDCEIWLAEYGGTPTAPGRYVIWQYTGEGKVNGITTPVDLSLDLAENR